MTIKLDNKIKNNSSELSVSGYKWCLREYDSRLVLSLSQKYDLPEIVSRVMAIRGINLDSAEDFLKPQLKNYLPNPLDFLDMDKAVSRIVDAITNKQKITIFGDYDVDGATSSAILYRYLTALGGDASIYIPDRIGEGYGPNAKALIGLKESGTDLLITVDCGTVSFEPIKAAKDAGLDVIIVDHHISTGELPEAVAVVNPNRLDESGANVGLAAVGVAFIVAIGVNSELRKRDFFAERKEPNLLSLLDIVALGTVCDVMPLTGLNRAFVSQGLKVMAKRKNVGLRALSDAAMIRERPDTYHLGFILGPRINAGGRVGKSDLGANLLITDDVDKAYEISLELNKLNEERRALEALVYDEAIEIVENMEENPPVLFVSGKGWHPGVVGIIASRLKEKYRKPVAIITIDSDGVGKASARSVTGVDLGAAITSARMENLLIAGGGHAMAAGFTVNEGDIPVLEKFICEKLKESCEIFSANMVKEFDGALSVSAIRTDLAESLEQIGPFGVGNPEPSFIIQDALVRMVRIVGENHIMCIISDASGNPYTVKSMAFRAVGTKLGDVLLSSLNKEINIAGKIKINRWQGREKAELVISDVLI